MNQLELPELTLVTLNGVNITENVKLFYGVNKDWNNKLWKYYEIFGKESLNNRFYIEYMTIEGRKYWTFGFINDLNQYFNPPKVKQRYNIESQLSNLSIS